MAAGRRLGFIGAGNMAEGILAAALAKGFCRAEEVIASDPARERLDLFRERFDVATTRDNVEVVNGGRLIVLAVKPQSFDDVAAGIAAAVTPDHLLLSIMAGVGTDRIAAAFPGRAVRVVRAMPNLPIRVGAGIAGVCAGAHATADDLAEVRALLDAGGSTVELKDEALLDAVTAVSGSGPAYFYYLVEAMTAGGVACGLSEHDALRLAEYTCLGAARMMLETGEPPAELRRRVTSQGGTTQAALEHMDREKVADAVREAVRAAFERSRELGSSG